MWKVNVIGEYKRHLKDEDVTIELEISLIRSSGTPSYDSLSYEKGFPSYDKIIIINGEMLDEDFTETKFVKFVKSWAHRAEVMCEALNKEGL